MGEYHWFAGNFIKYAGPLTKNDLPVDAHQLIALCAPRPVFISVGAPDVEGQWVDARGMFLSGLHAGPVYRLLGKNDIGAKQFPAQETSLTDGDIALGYTFNMRVEFPTIYPTAKSGLSGTLPGPTGPILYVLPAGILINRIIINWKFCLLK